MATTVTVRCFLRRAASFTRQVSPSRWAVSSHRFHSGTRKGYNTLSGGIVMPHDFMPGLAGVPAARSKISDVNGETGVLEYRGIRIEELAGKSTFLETAYLLLFNRLPTRL